MKVKGILNSDIAKGFADLGHMDLIAVGDCGLPIDNDKKIDLALKLGEPKFIDVLEVLLEDFSVEYHYLAEERRTGNPDQEKAIADPLKATPQIWT